MCRSALTQSSKDALSDERCPAQFSSSCLLVEVVARLGLLGVATQMLLALGIKTQLAQFYYT